MMKNILYVCLSLFLFSCGSSKVEVVNLNGTYKVMNLQGEDLSAQNYSITFTPAEHRVTGETGCNGFSAKYTQENNVLSVGRAIVATWQPHETVVLETIRAAGHAVRDHLQ